MSTTSNSPLVGFAAGFLSHLVFQGALGTVLYAAWLLPALPWRFTPTEPLGVPHTLSLAFWAGLWGIAYALAEPWISARLGRWKGGLLFAYLLPLQTHWFIAQPLKGFGIGGGFHAAVIPIELAFTAAFGLGLVFFLRAGTALAGRRGGAALQG
ncbi:MAG TPA: hypothetical protein VEB20_25795 [Azospirillaceae bacterium]|nr:hypothetical protein [Azospirillaceae bacterium]